MFISSYFDWTSEKRFIKALKYSIWNSQTLDIQNIIYNTETYLKRSLTKSERETIVNIGLLY